MKKKAFSQIKQQRVQALATFQTVHELAVTDEQIDGEHPAGGLVEPDMPGAFAVREVLEVEGQILSEGEMELGEVIEEGELAHGSVSEIDLSVYETEDGDFDTRDHTDKESDSESEEEEKSLCQFLVDWNARHKVTREAMKDLLSGLRTHHPELPLDPRTLLHTNLGYNVEDRCGGSYVYLSLAKSLRSALSKLHSITVDSSIQLALQFNIDGLPVFNSS